MVTALVAFIGAMDQIARSCALMAAWTPAMRRLVSAQPGAKMAGTMTFVGNHVLQTV